MIAFVCYALVHFFVASHPLNSSFRAKWILLFPATLLILYAIWIVLSDNKSEGVAETIKKIGLLLFAISFLLIERARNERTFQLILGSFVLAVVLVSFLCYGNALYNIITTGTLRHFDSDHTDYHFMYWPLTSASGILPIYLGMYCNLAFVILLATNLLPPWLKYTLAAYIAVFIVLIASKIGIIVLTLTTIFWILSTFRRGRVLFVAVTLAAILLFVFKVPYFKQRFEFSTKIDWEQVDSGQWSSATFRLAIWTCAIDAIKEEPLTGYGTADGFHALYSVYQERNFQRAIHDFYNAHNEFLTTALDLGVAGVAVILTMFVTGAIYASRKGSLLAFCFLMIAAGTFFIESVLVRQKGIVFFSFFFCFIFWHVSASKRLSSPAVHSSTDSGAL